MNSETNDGQKMNKEIEKLINSSMYWSEENLQVNHFFYRFISPTYIKNVENLFQPAKSIKDSDMAKNWMDGYAIEAQKILHEVALANWNYHTSLTEYNLQCLKEAEEVCQGCFFIKKI